MLLYPKQTITMGQDLTLRSKNHNSFKVKIQRYTGCFAKHIVHNL